MSCGCASEDAVCFFLFVERPCNNTFYVMLPIVFSFGYVAPIIILGVNEKELGGLGPFLAVIFIFFGFVGFVVVRFVCTKKATITV